MSKLNSEPIKIQVRDVYYNPIHNATIKIIERRSDKILYNQESANGEVILDDIENLKDCHAFKVEIQHSHYHSKPKTDSFCIREAHRGKYHTLEFLYQEKLLVSNVYVEIREQIQNTCEDNRANTICLPKRTYNIDNNTFAEQEALQAINHLQIYLKAYYNQDTIPNKDKQSNKQKQAYKEQKKETKWGIIIGNPNESQPVKDNAAFQILKNKDDYELKGEEIILNLKQEWLNQTIRIYAYIENPNHKVGNTLHIYTPIEYKEEGLVDVSGYVIGIVGVVGRNLAIKVIDKTRYIVSSYKVDKIFAPEIRISKGMSREILGNELARKWYVKIQIEKIPRLIKQVQSKREQAVMAHRFRNQAKRDTRDLMKDKKEAQRLDKTEKEYTWDFLVKKAKDKGKKGDEIYEYIIEASQRTRTSVNIKMGIK
ncbi:hypothetical protein [Helicobacter cinaedi]|uniref:hypothetical protein n=10 Tax=Helicobacter cinaedi TaxID=213 RepID=UPI001E423E4A|nr:hypothetical protein [Helicobacter cinaedi]